MLTSWFYFCINTYKLSKKLGLGKEISDSSSWFCKIVQNITYINSFVFWGVNGQNLVVEFFVELYSLEIVKHWQQVGLDGVGVASLTQDLQQSGVRHKEESGEQQTLLFKVSKGENDTLDNHFHFIVTITKRTVWSISSLISIQTNIHSYPNNLFNLFFPFSITPTNVEGLPLFWASKQQ